MTQTTTTPHVYVGTYAKYNNGSLKGEWVDLTQFSSYDDFLEHCNEIHADEEDPELMFQDFEGFPKRYYNESSLNEELWEYIELIDNGSDEDALNDFIEAGYELSDFEEAYQGFYKTEEDFAEQIVEECGYLDQMPENLRFYFDYEKFARDLFISDYWMSDNGYVFRRI